MRPRSADSLWPIGLAMLAVALGLPRTAVAQDQPKSTLNPVASLSRAQFKSFVAAPLFDPARSLPPPMVAPPPPPPPPVVQAQEPPPSVHLLGIIQGKRDIAIVRRDGTNKTEMFYSGDRIGAWQVTILSDVGIRLSGSGRDVDISLFPAPVPGTTPPPPPPSRPDL